MFWETFPIKVVAEHPKKVRTAGLTNPIVAEPAGVDGRVITVTLPRVFTPSGKSSTIPCIGGEYTVPDFSPINTGKGTDDATETVEPSSFRY
jgi:hypothetical protein